MGLKASLPVCCDSLARAANNTTLTKAFPKGVINVSPGIFRYTLVAPAPWLSAPQDRGRAAGNPSRIRSDAGGHEQVEARRQIDSVRSHSVRCPWPMSSAHKLLVSLVLLSSAKAWSGCDTFRVRSCDDNHCQPFYPHQRTRREHAAGLSAGAANRCSFQTAASASRDGGPLPSGVRHLVADIRRNDRSTFTGFTSRSGDRSQRHLIHRDLD